MIQFEKHNVSNIKTIAYDLWILEHYPDGNSAYLKCAEATEKMVETFPELKRVRGLASVEEPYNMPPTRTPHWWCVAPDGAIVDPTEHQYPTKIISYEESDETRGPPTGKCPNCGCLCYEGSYLCSDRCSDEYMAYLNNPSK